MAAGHETPSAASTAARTVDAPVAMVTGAARGLGAAVARALDVAGYRLVLTDIAVADVAEASAGAASTDPVPADPVPADPPSTDPPSTDAAGYPFATRAQLDAVAAGCAEAIPVRADVRSQGDMDAAARVALDRFGRLDVVVAAAGVIAGGPPGWETDDASWRLLLDVNLTGVLTTARATLPTLLTAPAGRFVAVSSAAGTRPLARLAAYSASKHGVIGLVRSIAADLAGTAVTANVVCPGSMDTTMLSETAKVYDLADPREFAQHAYLRRLLDPAEVAAAVAFLCSPAAGALTGAVIAADGGFTG